MGVSPNLLALHPTLSGGGESEPKTHVFVFKINELALGRGYSRYKFVLCLFL